MGNEPHSPRRHDLRDMVHLRRGRNADVARCHRTMDRAWRLFGSSLSHDRHAVQCHELLGLRCHGCWQSDAQLRERKQRDGELHDLGGCADDRLRKPSPSPARRWSSPARFASSALVSTARVASGRDRLCLASWLHRQSRTAEGALVQSRGDWRNCQPDITSGPIAHEISSTAAQIDAQVAGRTEVDIRKHGTPVAILIAASSPRFGWASALRATTYRREPASAGLMRRNSGVFSSGQYWTRNTAADRNGLVDQGAGWQLESRHMQRASQVDRFARQGVRGRGPLFQAQPPRVGRHCHRCEVDGRQLVAQIAESVMEQTPMSSWTCRCPSLLRRGTPYRGVRAPPNEGNRAQRGGAEAR